MRTSHKRSNSAADRIDKGSDTATLEKDNAMRETAAPQETVQGTCIAARMKRIELEIESLRHRLGQNRPTSADIEEPIDRIVTKRISSILETVIESVAAAAANILETSRDTGSSRAVNEHNRSSHEDKRPAIPVLPLSAVSKREREILAILLEGKSNREISAAVGISEKTVKNHLWKIYRKLGVKSRTQLFHFMTSR